MTRMRTGFAAIPAALAVILAMPALCAAAPMTSVEHQNAMQRAEADYRGALRQCKPLEGSAKQSCEADAKAAEIKAKADADAAYRNSDTRRDTQIESAKADYAVAKSRCDAMSGDARKACLKDAKSAEEDRIATARADAGQATLDADYRMAVEHCDTLSGAAKEHCLGDAKGRYGK